MLVTEDLLPRPFRYDSTDVIKSCPALLSPRKIPGDMKLAPGISAAWVSITASDLIGGSYNHGERTERFLQQYVKRLLVEIEDSLTELT